MHATPLSETALIPTIQIREGRKPKEKEGMKEGGRETKRGEGRLEGKGEGGREGGGRRRRSRKERREGLHLKMHGISFISRQI